MVGARGGVEAVLSVLKALIATAEPQQYPLCLGPALRTLHALCLLHARNTAHMVASDGLTLIKASESRA